MRDSRRRRQLEARLGPVPGTGAGRRLRGETLETRWMLFKPYTHVAVAEEAWLDAIDGTIEIEGQAYSLDAQLVTALQNQKSSYLAGAIGPDGFPDPVFGQAIVHPENTGLWLQHVLTAAWDAQADPQYASNPSERQRILAWSYGFLSHAASDVWSHTLVNYFAGGTFPDIGNSVPAGTVVADVQNALRHLAIEAYIGDATPGFDGNPSREPVLDVMGQPVLNDQGQPDYSDDGSWEISLDAPHQFIYDTFIASDAVRPAESQGLLLDFFYDLRAELTDTIGASTPQVFQLSQSVLDHASDCLSLPNFDAATCAASFGGDVGELLLASTRSDLLEATKIAYLRHWVDDIDRGLRHWSEFGLAVSHGLFDPQAKRNLQNELCANEGSETSTSRANCENGVGLLDVVLHEVGLDEIGESKFFNRYLLPMLGAPDIIVDIRNVLGEIGQEFSQFLDTLAEPFNPIVDAIAEVQEKARAFVQAQLYELVETWIGFDVQAFVDLMENPSGMVDLLSYTIDIGGQPVSVPLFDTGVHAELDGLLGIAHQGVGPLGDTVTFDANTFAVYQNAVTLSKLALLDGGEMDSVIRTLTGNDAYSFYGPRAGNIMTTAMPGVTLQDLSQFSGVSASSTLQFEQRQATALRQWLFSIDAAWAWQTPEYTVDGDQIATDYGGLGNFPLYYDQALRNSVFLQLFDDWQTNDSQGNLVGNLVRAGDTAQTPPPDAMTPAVEQVLVQGIDGVVDWLDALEQSSLIATPLPLLVDSQAVALSIADLLDISEIFDQFVAQPLENQWNLAGTSSSVDVVNLLKGLGGTLAGVQLELIPVTIGGGAINYFDATGSSRSEARYEFRLRARRTAPMAISLGAEAAEEFGLRDLVSLVDVTTTWDLDVAFGVDRTGGATDFYWDVRDFELMTQVLEQTYVSNLRVGFLGLEVYQGALRLEAGVRVAPINQQMRLTLPQLTTSPTQHVTQSITASDMQVELPVTADFGSFKGFITAAGIMNVKSELADVFSGQAPSTHVFFFDELLDFNNIDNLTFVGLLNVLKQWFDSLTISSIVNLFKGDGAQQSPSEPRPLATPASEEDELPVVGKTPDDVLDMGAGIAFDLIDPLVDGNERPEFVTAQDLASLVGSAIDQNSQFDYDPATKDLTYTLSFSHLLPLLEDQLLDFGVDGLGGLVGVETTSTIDIAATIDYQFTLGVNLNLDDSVIVAPRPAVSMGRLTSPARFRLTLFDNETSSGDPEQGPLATTYQVTVPPDPTNQTLADLIQDVNMALAAAGAAGRVVVRQNSVEPGRLELVGVGDDRQSVIILKAGLGAPEAPTDPMDATVLELGFDDLHATQGTLLDGVFLEEANFVGTLGVTASDIDASAYFGLAELGIEGGTAAGTMTLDFTLVDPTTGQPGGRIYLGEMFEALFDTATQIVNGESAGSLSGTLDVVLPLQATLFGQTLSGQAPNDPRIELHWNDVFRETPDVAVLNADQLIQLKNVTAEGIVDALRQLAEILSELQGESLYGVEIPGLGVSLGEVFDYADELAELVDLLRTNPAQGLNQLESWIETAFGLAPEALEISLAEQGEVLRIDLTLGAEFSKQLPLNFDLGGSGQLFDISGEGLLDAEAGVTFDLDFGIDLTDPDEPRPFLYETSNLGLLASVVGAGIDFNATLLAMGVAVADGQFVLKRSEQEDKRRQSPDEGAFLGLVLDDQNSQTTQGKIYLDDFFSQPGDYVGMQLDGAVDATLPLRVLVDGLSIPVGDIKLQIGDLSDLENTTVLTVPDFDQYFEQFNLYDNLQGLVTAIDLILQRVETLLQGQVFGVRLPFVGDNLQDAVTFVRDFREGMFAELQARFAEHQNKTTEVARHALFDALGPQGLGLLGDLNSDTVITIDDVAAVSRDTDENGSPDEIEFDLRLAQSLTFLELPVAFDIGLPGLGLALDGNVEVGLGFDWRLSFGLSRDDGFYFDTGQQDELILSLDARIPGFEARGDLFFLQVTAADDPANPSHFGPAIRVDFRDPVGEGDRLTFDELLGGGFDLSEVISAEITGNAELNLDLVVSIEGDGRFPSIATDFSVIWPFLENTDLASEGGAGDKPVVKFDNIRLHVGEFLSDYVAPVLQTLHRFTKPLDPLIEFITEPIPGLKEIGLNLTPNDLGRLFGYEEVADFVEIFGAIVTTINDVPTVGDIYVPLGSFSIGDDEDEERVDLRSASELTADDLYILTQTPDTIAALRDEQDEDADEAADFFETLKMETGLEFPIIESPATIFKLLLGQTVDLVLWDAPILGLGFVFPFFKLPILPQYGLYASFAGFVQTGIDLNFGFDTHGFEVYQETGNPLDIFSGFFLWDHQQADGTGPDVPEAFLRTGVTGSVELTTFVLGAGLGGTIHGTLGADLVDPDDDGRVHLDEFLERLTDGTRGVTCTFDLVGSLGASLTAYVEILGARIERNLPDPPFELPGFRWSDPACYPDRFEGDSRNNEDLDDATHLGVGPGLHLEGLSISPANDVDWYSFELLRATDIVVNIQHAAARGDLDVELYRLDASQHPELIAQSHSPRDIERLSARGLEPGVYYLRVDSPTNERNSYKLDILPGEDGTRVFYINNNSDDLSIHYYTTDKGDDRHDGLSPRKPIRTLQHLLDTYDLGPQDIVVFETGSHPTPATIGQEDSGAIFVGTVDGSTLGSLTIEDVDAAIFYRLLMDSPNVNLTLNNVTNSRFDRMHLVSAATNIVAQHAHGNQFGGQALSLQGTGNVSLTDSTSNSFAAFTAEATDDNFSLTSAGTTTIATGVLTAGRTNIVFQEVVDSTIADNAMVAVQSNLLLAGSHRNRIEQNTLESSRELEPIAEVTPRVPLRPGVWIQRGGIADSSDNLVRANELRHHHTGIQIDSPAYNLVEQNSLVDNGGIGVFVARGVRAELRSNDVSGRELGMYIDSTIAENFDNEFLQNGIGVESMYGVIGPANPAPYGSGGKAPNRILSNTIGVSIPTGASGVLVHFNTIERNTTGIRAFGDRSLIVANFIADNQLGAETTEVLGPADWDDSLYNILRENHTGARVYGSGTVQFNRFEQNQTGIEALSQSYVHHNLLIKNTQDGIVTQHAVATIIEHNTIHAVAGKALRVAGFSTDVAIQNNILFAETGYALYIEPDSQFGYHSDYNNLYTPGTGRVAFQGKDFVDLYDWQVEADQDLHSIGYTIVNPALDDPQFTLADPRTDKYKVPVGATSVDAGSPASPFGDEPVPSGGRANLGAYGNTTQATRSDSHWLRITEPNFYRDLIPSSTYPITWEDFNLAGSSLKIELIEEGVGVVGTIATSVSTASGQATWSPASLGVAGDLDKRYRVRLTTISGALAAQAASREAFAIVPFDPGVANVFYVNDRVDANDQYSTAAGDNRNTGLAANAPKVVIRPLVLSYPMGSGDEIRVDTGSYVHAVNLNLSQVTQGFDPRMQSVSGTRIVGPTNPLFDRVVIDRANPYAGSRAIDLIQAPDMVMRNLEVTGAEIGTRVRQSSTKFDARQIAWYGHSLDGLSIESHSDGGMLRELSAHDNGRDGVVVESLLDLLFVSQVYDNGRIGIALRQTGGARVEANKVFGNWRGMEIINPLADTTVVGGIDWTSARGNQVFDNDDDGVLAAGNVLVVHNTVRDNATIGIRLDNGADARGNVVVNHITGISAFGSSSDIVENRSYLNSRSGIEASYFSQIVRNVVYSNEVHGIHVEHFSGLIDHNLVYSTGTAPINVQGPGFDAQLINNTVYEPCAVNVEPDTPGTTVTTDWDWQLVLQPPLPPPPPLLTPDPVFVSLWGNATFSYGPASSDDGQSFDLGAGGGSQARTPLPLPAGSLWHIPFEVTELQLSSLMFEPHPQLGFAEIVFGDTPAVGNISVSNVDGFLVGRVTLDLAVGFFFPQADLMLQPLEPLHLERELSLTGEILLDEFQVLQAAYRLFGPMVETGGQLIQEFSMPPWNWRLENAMVTRETYGGPQDKGPYCPEIGVIVQDFSQDVLLRNNIVYVEGVGGGDPGVPPSVDVVVTPDSIEGWDSEFNLLTTKHGAIGRFNDQLAPTIEAWRQITLHDDYGIAPDPDSIWVDPDGDDGILGQAGGDDDNFHLASPFGQALTGALAPIISTDAGIGMGLPRFVDPVFTRDMMPDADYVSPAVDWGGPSFDWLAEPGIVPLESGGILAIEHGQMINLGTYGNTRHASASPEPYLNFVYPLGAETLFRDRTYDIEWRSNMLAGLMRIDVIHDGGGSESSVTIPNPGTSVGKYSWSVPNNFPIGNDYCVRITIGSEQFDSRRCAIQIIDDVVAPTVVTNNPQWIDKQRWSNVDLSSLTMTVSENVDASVATDASHYELRGAGVNRLFDDGDDQVYSINATYSPGAHDGLSAIVTLDFAGVALPEGIYRLTVMSAAFSDFAGNVLDGNRDGIGGDDYVRIFEIDKTAPVVTLPTVQPDPRNVGIDAMTIEFNELVHGVGLANAHMSYDTLPNRLSGWQGISEADPVPNAFGSAAWRLSDIADLYPSRPNPTLLATTSEPDQSVSQWQLQWNAYGIVDRAGNALQMDPSSAWELDRRSPSVVIVPVTPDPHAASVNQLQLVFSEVVLGVTLSSLHLSRDGEIVPLSAGNAPSSADGITWTVSNLASLTAPSGVYLLTVDSESGITDPAGNPLTQDGHETFQFDNLSPAGLFIDLPTRRNDALNELVLRFDEPVMGVDVSDLRLTRNGSGINLITQLIQPPTLTTLDHRTWRLSGLVPVTSVDGEYDVEIIASSSGIVDVTGQLLTANIHASWITDQTPSTSAFVAITPNPLPDVINTVLLEYSEPVAGLTLSHLQWMAVTEAGAVESPLDQFSGVTLDTHDGGQTWTIGGLNALSDLDGIYTIAVVDPSSVVRDAAGNVADIPASLSWTRDATAPTVSLAQVAPDPRKSPVGSIDIIFSETVQGLTLDDLQLTRSGSANLIGLSQQLVMIDSQTYRLQGLDSLTDEPGRYALSLAAPGSGITDLAGNLLLVGAYTSFSIQSNGDVNGDGQINSADIDRLFLALAQQETQSAFDANGDGHINRGDVDYVVADVFHTWYGDADLSGVVDGVDFNAWYTRRFTSGASASWATGDFNGDKSVDVRDFNLWYANRFRMRVVLS